MTWGEGGHIPAHVKTQVLRRDKTCRLAYPDICTTRIDEYDHITGLAERGLRRRGTNTANELQGVCQPCHRRKTEQQRRAGVANAIAKRGGLSRRLRDREPHPGGTG